MRRRCGIVLLLLLGGCASAPSPPPPPPPPQPETEPPYRQIIAEKLGSMFTADSGIRGVSISGARRGTTPANPHWRVCLRGTSKSVTRTYAIFISRQNQVIDRRVAQPEDDCDRERYERLART